MKAHAEDGAKGTLGQRFLTNAGVGYDFVGLSRPRDTRSKQNAEQQAYEKKTAARIYANRHN
jgi:hypothetical protein